MKVCVEKVGRNVDEVWIFLGISLIVVDMLEEVEVKYIEFVSLILIENVVIYLVCYFDDYDLS